MLKILLLIILTVIPITAYADVESKSARLCTVTAVNYTVLGIFARLIPDTGEKEFKNRVKVVAEESNKENKELVIQLGDVAWKLRKSEMSPSDIATGFYDMCIKRIGTII